MLEEQLTDDLLHKMASEASEGAINEAFALGLSITVQKDGKIVEIFPDGSEKITEQLIYHVERINDQEGTISLSWEKVLVKFSFVLSKA